LPFQQGSSLQVTRIDRVYARPGAGKSILSNTLKLSVCLKSEQTKLPYLAILDIGPCRKGLISLLERQEAYYASQTNEIYTINPFDTRLGARYQDHQERILLVNFLVLLVARVEETAYDGMAGMAGLIIDELCKPLSD
jgi:intracellular multiplication protein IcmB